jgi:hypothetical protein
MGIEGIVRTLIIAIGREERFFVPIADSMALAADDFFFLG